MADITIIRSTRGNVNNIPIVDGQLILEIDQDIQNKIYMDRADGVRVEYGINGFLPSFPLSIGNGGTGQTTLEDTKNTLGIPQLPLSVDNGGTGAIQALQAKVNLGITYGNETPTLVPSTGEGTIYYKIL